MSKPKATEAGGNTNLLDNFAWDDQDSFFGIKEESNVEKQKKFLNEVEEEADDDEPTEVETQTTTKKPETPESEKSDEGEDDEEDELFPETEVKATETGAGDEPDEDVEFYSTLSQELKTKGVFQFAALPEDGQITEEKFFELQEEEVEGRTEQAVQDFIAEMNDEDGAAFIKFKRAGGKTSDFFEFYSQMSAVPEVDIETEAGQDAILKHYFKTVEQLEDDDITDKLEWLKESGKKKKYAEKYNDKINADKKAAKDQFLIDQAEAQKQRETEKKEFIGKIKTTASTVTNVNGFVFNKKDAEGYVDFIIKPAVKVGNQYLTAFQAELSRVIKEEPENLLIIAKLLKTKFDTSDMVISKETEATKKLKSNLASKASKLSSSPAANKKRSLSEYFN